MGELCYNGIIEDPMNTVYSVVAAILGLCILRLLFRALWRRWNRPPPRACNCCQTPGQCLRVVAAEKELQESQKQAQEELTAAEAELKAEMDAIDEELKK